MQEQVSSFPTRVTLYDDGAYRWTYDMKAYRNPWPIRTMIAVCAAVFVPVALIMLVMIWQYGPWQAILWCLVLLAIGVALPALIWVLSPPNPSYKMGGERIEGWPRGRSRNIHDFKDVRSVTLRPDLGRIELHETLGSLHVYVPPEDYELVRDYVLAHIPEDAKLSQG